MSVMFLMFALLFVVAMLQLQQQIEQNQHRRIMIIQALTKQLNENGIHAEINKETGDISLMESVLFDLDSWKLKQDGKKFLQTFIPVYSKVIFSSDDIAKEIVRVVVEGYTSSAGGFSHNMDLSLRRAGSVVRFAENLDFPHRNAFLNKLMAAGRGEIEADQMQDKVSDRKVKFRFQFRGDDVGSLIRELQESIHHLGKTLLQSLAGEQAP